MNCVGCGKITLGQSWLCPACALTQKVVLPRLVIGITGRARHGKNTIAEVMAQGFEKAGYLCSDVTVSDIVWAEASKLRKVRSHSRASASKWELDNLVALGHSERDKDEDHWISAVAAAVVKEGATTGAAQVAVMAGVRFHNEVTWLRKFPGGIIIKVVRYNTDGSLFISPDRDPNDKMETTVDEIKADFEFTHQTGQTDWLISQAKAFMSCTFGINP